MMVDKTAIVAANDGLYFCDSFQISGLRQNLWMAGLEKRSGSHNIIVIKNGVEVKAYELLQACFGHGAVTFSLGEGGHAICHYKTAGVQEIMTVRASELRRLADLDDGCYPAQPEALVI